MLNPRSRFSIFFLKNFIAMFHLLKLMIYLELIFIYGVRFRSRLISFLHMVAYDCPIILVVFVEKISLPPINFLPPLSISVSIFVWLCFWILYSVLLIYVCPFLSFFFFRVTLSSLCILPDIFYVYIDKSISVLCFPFLVLKIFTYSSAPYFFF